MKLENYKILVGIFMVRVDNKPMLTLAGLRTMPIIHDDGSFTIEDVVFNAPDNIPETVPSGDMGRALFLGNYKLTGNLSELHEVIEAEYRIFAQDWEIPIYEQMNYRKVIMEFATPIA